VVQDLKRKSKIVYQLNKGVLTPLRTAKPQLIARKKNHHVHLN